MGWLIFKLYLSREIFGRVAKQGKKLAIEIAAALQYLNPPTPFLATPACVFFLKYPVMPGP